MSIGMYVTAVLGSHWLVGGHFVWLEPGSSDGFAGLSPE